MRFSAPWRQRGAHGDGEAADAATVAVMGRVVARRVMGKAAFLGIGGRQRQGFSAMVG
jgi:lysyl-tRNA synthetase class II